MKRWRVSAGGPPSGPPLFWPSAKYPITSHSLAAAFFDAIETRIPSARARPRTADCLAASLVRLVWTPACCARTAWRSQGRARRRYSTPNQFWRSRRCRSCIGSCPIKGRKPRTVYGAGVPAFVVPLVGTLVPRRARPEFLWTTQAPGHRGAANQTVGCAPGNSERRIRSVSKGFELVEVIRGYGICSISTSCHCSLRYSATRRRWQ